MSNSFGIEIGLDAFGVKIPPDCGPITIQFSICASITMAQKKKTIEKQNEMHKYGNEIITSFKNKQK